MRRRVFLALAGGAFAVPFAAFPQQAGKTVRIGYLAMDFATGTPGVREAFVQGLREHGYVEGTNLVIEYRDAHGKPDQLARLAAELAALKVDVIIASGGSLGALAAKRATTTIPIVFPFVGDPVTDGLASSLARPGGNVTGLSSAHTDLVGKWLELLKQTVPKMGLVAYLLKPDAAPKPTIDKFLTEAEIAAKALGAQLRVFEAQGQHDFDRAFSDIASARPDALVVQATPVFDTAGAQRRLVDLAAENRLPAMYSTRTYVEAGGLMSYGPNMANLFSRAAGLADKILKGTKPADLPIEQPTKFELIINLKTAKALGLTIPPSILARADEIIE